MWKLPKEATVNEQTRSINHFRRRRHDVYFCQVFRFIKGIPSVMIMSFGQRSFYKSNDLEKNMVCLGEIFNRIFCPIFPVDRNEIWEAFLDFVVLKGVGDRVKKIFILFKNEGLVSCGYEVKFMTMLRMRNKPSLRTLSYFYQNNMCFRSMVNWIEAQVNINIPDLKLNSFMNDHFKVL